MLYGDDAYIVLRSPYGLAKMTEVIVEVCRAFANRIGEEGRDHAHASTAYTVDYGASRNDRKTYKPAQSFTYLGGAVTGTPDGYVG